MNRFACVHPTALRTAVRSCGGAGLAALALLLGGCGDEVRLTPEAQRAGFTPPVGTPLEYSWDLPLNGPVLRSWTSPATPDRIFFQIAPTNEIICIDLASGATRWTTVALPKPIMGQPFLARTKVPADNQGNPAYDDDRLYLVVDDQLMTFDANTGHLIWRYELPFPPSTGPVAVGSGSAVRIFIGDWDNRIQVVSFNQEHQLPYIAWQFYVGSPVTSEASEREELTSVSDFKGVVRTFKVEREEVWSFPTGNTVQGGVATTGRLLFVGNDNNTLFALNRLNGEKLAQLNLNGPVRRRPLLFKGEPERVYVWVDHADPAIGGFYAIRAQLDSIPYVDTTRHPLEVVRLGVDWRIAGIDRIVGSTPKHLFATGKDSAVVQAIDRATGSISWTWDLSAGRHAPVTHITPIIDPTDTVRSVVSADAEGHVVAYRLFRYVPGEGPATVLTPEPAEPPAKPKAKPPAKP